jgi:uncharacterized membrane protein YdjX (TVP38/TMEM64 family)
VKTAASTLPSHCHTSHPLQDPPLYLLTNTMARSNVLCYWVGLQVLSVNCGTSSAFNIQQQAALQGSTDLSRGVFCRGGALNFRKEKAHLQTYTTVVDESPVRSKSTAIKLSSTALEPTSSNGINVSIGNKNVRLALVAIVSAALLFSTREAWLPLMDRHKIQQGTLTILNGLKGPPGSSNVAPLCAYGVGIAVWEVLGLSTIPVESAAAMAFGWEAGIASAIGKLCGALTAFSLGRGLLREKLHSRLQGYKVIGLVENSKRPAWQTALLFKFSCFPELLKNCGPALFPTIRPWMFIMATVLHGWAFTGLWTWFGVDTALRLGSEAAIPTNASLQAALAFGGTIGFLLAPVFTAWWLKSMAQEATHQKDVHAY